MLEVRKKEEKWYLFGTIRRESKKLCVIIYFEDGLPSDRWVLKIYDEGEREKLENIVGNMAKKYNVNLEIEFRT